MAMASDSKFYPLHFVLFPFMAQGHMIPMIDIAKLLAQHGIKVTVVTTPLNAKRFETTLARAVKSGLQIHFIQLQFPAAEAGLPKDCEYCDMLPSLGLGREFFSATNMLQEPVEKLLQNLIPRPNCIISDMCLPYTGQVARKLGVPRIAFNGYCCFTMLCMQRIHSSGILENIKSESEYFSVPDLPDHVEINKQQLPQAVLDNMDQFGERVLEAETMTYGIINNSFEEMESAYVQEYRKVQAGKVWCIGPVSLCNKDNLDKAERGDKASIQESECMNFLESQKPGSVIYVCFGSLCNLVTCQLIELALGLEASNKPFIWVIRRTGRSKELENWVEDTNFKERTKGKCLIIRGWAPQVVILSHPSIGGFLITYIRH